VALAGRWAKKETGRPGKRWCFSRFKAVAASDRVDDELRRWKHSVFSEAGHHVRQGGLNNDLVQRGTENDMPRLALFHRSFFG